MKSAIRRKKKTIIVLAVGMKNLLTNVELVAPKQVGVAGSAAGGGGDAGLVANVSNPQGAGAVNVNRGDGSLQNPYIPE